MRLVNNISPVTALIEAFSSMKILFLEIFHQDKIEI